MFFFSPEELLVSQLYHDHSFASLIPTKHICFHPSNFESIFRNALHLKMINVSFQSKFWIRIWRNRSRMFCVPCFAWSIFRLKPTWSQSEQFWWEETGIGEYNFHDASGLTLGGSHAQSCSCLFLHYKVYMETVVSEW